MYKVFLNDRKITIGEKGNITLKKPPEFIVNLDSQEEFKSWFFQFVESDLNEVFITTENILNFWQSVFQPSFKLVPAAGGVVIRDNKMLFIFRNGNWDLPKGKIDRNESVEKAAVREVGEECGINGHKIIKKLPSTFHIYKSQYKDSFGKWILKETFWFEMHYSGREEGTPQTEENITEIRWVNLNELDDVLLNTYESLKSVIQLYRD